jgi:hypothetical protein
MQPDVVPEADGWEGDDGLPIIEDMVLQEDLVQREEFKTGDDNQDGQLLSFIDEDEQTSLNKVALRMSVTSNSPFEGSFARAEVDMVSNILDGKNHRGSTLRDSEGKSIDQGASPEKEIVVSDLDDLEPDNEDTFNT